MTKILIIDDNTRSRDMLIDLVHSIDPNAYIETFDDAQSTLDWCSRYKPDLVLTDFAISGMNGSDWLAQLISQPLMDKVPVVVFAGSDDKTIRYEALLAGATDFLTKPIDRYECIARCSNLLKLGRQQQLILDRSIKLKRQVILATNEIRGRERETLLRLTMAGGFRDKSTGNHLYRVAQRARLVAEQLGLSSDDCDLIQQAAPMHDIGKVGISDDLLRKESTFTPDEQTLMQEHTHIGYQILKDSQSKYLQAGAIIARSHHERFDGSGYPHGLAGKQIPLMARIVAVADVFDALINERPYKATWSEDSAFRYVERQSGKHFDPECADAFLAQRANMVNIPRTPQPDTPFQYN